MQGGVAPRIPCWPQPPPTLHRLTGSAVASSPFPRPSRPERFRLSELFFGARLPVRRSFSFLWGLLLQDFHSISHHRSLQSMSESRILCSGASESLEAEPGSGSHALVPTARTLSLTENFYHPGHCTHSPHSAGASPTGSSPTGSHCKKAFGLAPPRSPVIPRNIATTCGGGPTDCCPCSPTKNVDCPQDNDWRNGPDSLCHITF